MNKERRQALHQAEEEIRATHKRIHELEVGESLSSRASQEAVQSLKEAASFLLEAISRIDCAIEQDGDQAPKRPRKKRKKSEPAPGGENQPE